MATSKCGNLVGASFTDPATIEQGKPAIPHSYTTRDKNNLSMAFQLRAELPGQEDWHKPVSWFVFAGCDLA